MCVIPSSRAANTAAIATLASLCSRYQVPSPTLGTLTPVGPNTCRGSSVLAIPGILACYTWSMKWQRGYQSDDVEDDRGRSPGIGGNGLLGPALMIGSRFGL